MRMAFFFIVSTMIRVMMNESLKAFVIFDIWETLLLDARLIDNICAFHDQSESVVSSNATL